jgi:hypothetical protein
MSVQSFDRWKFISHPSEVSIGWTVSGLKQVIQKQARWWNLFATNEVGLTLYAVHFIHLQPTIAVDFLTSDELIKLLDDERDCSNGWTTFLSGVWNVKRLDITLFRIKRLIELWESR